MPGNQRISRVEEHIGLNFFNYLVAITPGNPLQPAFDQNIPYLERSMGLGEIPIDIEADPKGSLWMQSLILNRSYLWKLNAIGGLDSEFQPDPGTFVDPNFPQNRGTITFGFNGMPSWSIAGTDRKGRVYLESNRGDFEKMNGVSIAPTNLLRLLPDGSVDETFGPVDFGDGGIYFLRELPDHSLALYGVFSECNGSPMKNRAILDEQGTVYPNFVASDATLSFVNVPLANGGFISFFDSQLNPPIGTRMVKLRGEHPEDVDFSEWKFHHGIDLNASPDSDDDQDQVSLLLEYAFGLNPQLRDPHRLPRLVRIGDRIGCICGIVRNSLSYGFQHSTDLSTWSEDVLMVDKDEEGYRMSLSTSSARNGYIRIVVHLRE